MLSSRNGWHDGRVDPIRRLRFDPSMWIDPARPVDRGSPARSASGLAVQVPEFDSKPGASGRRFVVAGVAAVLVFWLVLYAFFHDWRERYRARAAYGTERVAPEVVAFAERTPSGVDPDSWRDAVARTRAMLVTVTSANVLDMDDLLNLRDELQRAVARVRSNPNRAVAELAWIWDTMRERGEFLLRDTRTGDADRHPRPTILPSYGEDRVAPGLDPMVSLEVPGVDRQRWREAVASTRALLLEVTASRRISAIRMISLRKEIDRAADHARAHPGLAVRELGVIWETLVRLCPSLFRNPDAVLAPHPRPGILEKDTRARSS